MTYHIITVITYHNISYHVILFDYNISQDRIYEGQDEGQKVVARKVEDAQKSLFPRIVWGPLGCHLLSSLVPKSRFRGSGKITFFKKSFEVKKDAELPPEYFPCGGSA